MKIKFLKHCKAPQEYTRVFCECCGPEPMGYIEQFFCEGEEHDPEEYHAKIDLSGLTYRVDYDIIEYP